MARSRIWSSLLLCAAALPLLLWAAPPPSVQFAADCAAPIYASDMLVCNDPELLELDRRLAVLIAEPARADAGVASRESSEEAHWDWFRRSRMCAFKSDHRACLLSAYRGRIAVLDKNLASGSSGGAGADAESVVEVVIATCETRGKAYLPAASISASGFATGVSPVPGEQGSDIRIWGYVDHRNMYGDDAARAILGDWWSGYGPDAATWRFDLKARPDDPAGHSFTVHVPNDRGSGSLMRLFVSDGRAGRATRVYLDGKLFSFEAPANMKTLRGLRLELQSSASICQPSLRPAH